MPSTGGRISVESRVLQYPVGTLHSYGGKLFCSSCMEPLSMKKDTIDDHIRSIKHRRRLALRLQGTLNSTPLQTDPNIVLPNQPDSSIYAPCTADSFEVPIKRECLVDIRESNTSSAYEDSHSYNFGLAEPVENNLDVGALPSTSSSKNDVVFDLIKAFTEAKIPLEKIDCPQFRAFITKYIGDCSVIPRSASLKEIYCPIIVKLQQECYLRKYRGQKLAVALREKLSDLHTLIRVEVYFYMLHPSREQNSWDLVYHTDVPSVTLDIVSSLLERALRIFDVESDSVCAILFERPYSNNGKDCLTDTFPKAQLIVCWKHTLNQILNKWRDIFIHVNELVETFQAVFQEDDVRRARFCALTSDRRDGSSSMSISRALPYSVSRRNWTDWYKAVRFHHQHLIEYREFAHQESSVDKTPGLSRFLEALDRPSLDRHLKFIRNIGDKFLTVFHCLGSLRHETNSASDCDSEAFYLYPAIQVVISALQLEKSSVESAILTDTYEYDAVRSTLQSLESLLDDKSACMGSKFFSGLHAFEPQKQASLLGGSTDLDNLLSVFHFLRDSTVLDEFNSYLGDSQNQVEKMQRINWPCFRPREYWSAMETDFPNLASNVLLALDVPCVCASCADQQ